MLVETLTEDKRDIKHGARPLFELMLVEAVTKKEGILPTD